jgi:glutamate/tyrosine decarboxylase-like PLP-dependent enzyme
MSSRELLRRAAEIATDYLDRLPERRVGSLATVDEMRRALGGPLPETGTAAAALLERFASAADPGIVATAGPRYFGFVVGGSMPVTVAVDWLVSTWDQNAGLFVLSPANAVAEETAGEWLRELFGLPSGASVGFVTGCQAANFSALAAARHALSQRAGWDVEARGLYGAPEIEVVVGGEAHVTVHTALQMLGLGRERVHRVAIDDQGRMLPAALAATLAPLAGRPTLVCAQAGNVNSGAFDPLDEIADLTQPHDAWLHVDAAFGLWAGASPALRNLVRGVGRADSWATDAHKWLNVPYDSGLVFCAHPEAHRAALTAHADYLEQTEGRERDSFEWAPEFSRRARGFTVWAALSHLGRSGVAELVERCCRHARRFSELLATPRRIEILNDVVLNQVLVRFTPPGGTADDAEAGDDYTREVIRRVQLDGTCWLSGTTWQGRAAMRISVSNWSTTDADVVRSAAAILQAAEVAA